MKLDSEIVAEGPGAGQDLSCKASSCVLLHYFAIFSFEEKPIWGGLNFLLEQHHKNDITYIVASSWATSSKSSSSCNSSFMLQMLNGFGLPSHPGIETLQGV